MKLSSCHDLDVARLGLRRACCVDHPAKDFPTVKDDSKCKILFFKSKNSEAEPGVSFGE